MSKESAVQPAKDEVIASEVATPVVENNVPVTAETVPSEPKKQVATAAKKVAAKPKAAKQAVAEKPAKNVVAEKSAPTPKSPAKPVKKAPAAAKEKVAEAPKAEKAAKVKKPKLVRDSFTIPESDYALFATLKQRALTAGVDVKKSEVLRAALVTLAKLDDAELVKAIGLVERIQTGRPKK